jgi:hypothetical protein
MPLPCVIFAPMSGRVAVVADAITTVRHAPASPVGARTLDRIVEASEVVEGVWADHIQPGDWIVVRTRNSLYSLAALGKGFYRAAGGWFAGSNSDGRDVRIVGCTWGGAAIHTRVAAAVGMFLEFDNGVRTTRIREVRHLRGGGTTH